MPDLAELLQWVRLGADSFTKVLAAENDDRLTEQSTLPGWTRGDVVAHVTDVMEECAAALSATTKPAGPDSSGERTATVLRENYRQAASALQTALAARPNRSDWKDSVTVRAEELPSEGVLWLLARELMVHATDLGGEVSFGDLPNDFLGALIDDIVRHRAGGDSRALEILSQDTGEAWRLEGSGEPLRVMALASDMGAWLAGREGGKVKVLGPGELPTLSPWL